jgi:hypothetical protein
MRKLAPLLLLLILGTSVLLAQQQPLTQVPPKPTCTLIFKTGPCADLWRAYNQALAQRQREEIQLYVERQKELASQAATAPLQQQIADLNRLVSEQQAQLTKLQRQIEADAASAVQVKEADAADKADARQRGLWLGYSLGWGSAIVALAIWVAISRLLRSRGNNSKPQASSASA